MATTDPVSVIGTAAQGLGDNLIAVGGQVLPIAATILALTVGWRFARKFIKG